MKYVYVKNGDAAEQLARIADAGYQCSPNGPDAFISSFLTGASKDAVTLVSRGIRRANFSDGQFQAKTRRGGRGDSLRLLRRFGYALFLAKTLWQERPDRIICGSTGSQLMVSWLHARVFGVPLVHSRHNSLRLAGGSLQNRLRRSLDAFLIRRVDAVVAHGPFLKDQVLSLNYDADQIFEFEVSFPRVEPASGDSNVALYVGRMEPGKGIFDLLDAGEKLLASGADIELVFVGGGAALDRLQQKIEASPVAGNIRAVGRVPHDEVMQLFTNARVVLTPTRREFPEGRCMVVLESLALGIPVIAPSHGPFPYAVKHNENGLLFESDNREDLRQCLEQAMTNDTLYTRLRQGALATATELAEDQVAFADAVNHAFNHAEAAR